MCFFDHSFAHNFFLFHFVAKPMLEFRENDVLSDCSKIQQLELSLEEKSSFFAAPEVAWCCWPGCYGNLPSFFGVAEYAIILPVFESWTVAELFFKLWPRVR